MYANILVTTKQQPLKNSSQLSGLQRSHNQYLCYRKLFTVLAKEIIQTIKLHSIFHIGL